MPPAPGRPTVDSQRDPRLDPRPGDVLALGKHRILHTVRHVDRFVRYVVPVKKGDLSCACKIAEWRIWLATAEVIHRAEDATPPSAPVHEPQTEPQSETPETNKNPANTK